jgi:hypothetical protein
MPVADSPGRRGEYVDVRPLPVQWVKLAESRGIAGSANALALKAGVATTTLTRLVFGESSSPATIRKVAKVLGVSQERVRDLAGIPTPLGVWVPPEQANSLDRPTRDALDALILAISRRGEPDAIKPVSKKIRREDDVRDANGDVLDISDVQGGGDGPVGDPHLGFVVEVGVDEDEAVPEQE